MTAIINNMHFRIFLFLLSIACCFGQAHAFNAGDTIALILGLAIGILGICACIGVYARRKAGNSG
ncbi:hypothetical protein BOX15_Mlig010363g3 [Macrostomum lignano]|uniref:Uncharacterized protein n=1 Tax=Macrostomum lignano TaxID=282301 RepID=A0A267DV88_9PLAT|nr:hypothetical protein BOX15_Mlig010363g2 [Macrostomum lignano]PAA58156.1 hypothetical protein BOX15_Mlig010363g1 [Macrostomum lignano]PAA83749.1 hypothetical protein BOX15_Mlig010363g3 [Macrostomum lignano]